ncbi:MAG: glycosyltransferase, partial [Limnospira sp. PMC 894.15]|uniref:glycosyltransferase n=1 Tax=Limnospira sp. PMC 894.15 TaxID=2981100 RepID=UPI0028E15715
MNDFNRGNELLRKGKVEEAVAAYQKAIAHDPSFHWYHEKLGEAFEELQHWEKAIAAYQKAIGQNRDFYLAYQNLGEALEKLGRFDEAIAAYRRAVELKPEAAWSYVNLSRVLRQVGRVEEAEKAEEQGGGIHPKLGVVRSLPSDFSMNSTHQISSTTTAKNNNYSIPKSPSQSAPKKASPGRRLSHRKSQLSSSQNFLKPPHFTAQDFGERLWGGYSRYALPALEEIKHDLTAAKSERIQAAWELVCWYYVDGDYELALENIELINILGAEIHSRYLLAEIQCLIKLNRINQAEKRLDFAIQVQGEKADFLLLKANIQRIVSLQKGQESEAKTLTLYYINKIYEKQGLSPLVLKDHSLPLSLSNITAHAEPKIKNQKLKVSVIIPAYNAAETIHIALDSLLAQTWRNIEIIVVDDCSSDHTREVVAGYVERDRRVKLIAKDVNEGCYPTRNRGLASATGDLIMVNDSDDWSHPQKIEYQIEVMNNQKSFCIAVMSHWVRVDENLMVVRGGRRPKHRLFDLNFSSLMFKRKALDKVGVWDAVRIGGDKEFQLRLEKAYGAKALYRIKSDIMLSLGMARENSLTRAKTTHIKTIKFGIRWHYRDSCKYWHSRPDFATSPKLSEEVRSFPCPKGNHPLKSETYFYDGVVVADWANGDSVFVCNLNFVVAACRSGLKVAVVHWRSYNTSPNISLQSSFYDVCVKYGVDILTPGDQVEAKIIVFGCPKALQHRLDDFPAINADKLIVIVNQFAEGLIDGSEPQYDPYIVRANLKTMFGKEGDWIPSSLSLQRLMTEDERYPKPYPTPWYPMIDVEQWCRQKLRWRGQGNQRPVVGRHGANTSMQWPGELTAFKQIYGVDNAWDVRILGSAKGAIDLLGKQPKNWQFISGDRMGMQEFLEDLDLFIYYPNKSYIEALGIEIIQAMAVGIPVILDPQFQETFGGAALYANPEQVSLIVQELWSDPEQYINRAKIGRDFVYKNFDYRRVMNIIDCDN